MTTPILNKTLCFDCQDNSAFFYRQMQADYMHGEKMTVSQYLRCGCTYTLAKERLK